MHHIHKFEEKKKCPKFTVSINNLGYVDSYRGKMLIFTKRIKF